MKMLFDDAVYQEILERINKISADTAPQWGKMNAAQMFLHASKVQDVMNGVELENTPFIAKLFKGAIRKSVVNEKPYKQGTQTHPQYRVTNSADFDASKKKLLDALAKFKAENADGPSAHVHTLFGVMSHEEKGWSMYKHLDHHLKQFGV